MSGRGAVTRAATPDVAVAGEESGDDAVREVVVHLGDARDLLGRDAGVRR